MCTIVEIDGKEIETVGELKKVWPALFEDARYILKEAKNDSCLCPIDIERTAKKYGRRATQTPFGYKIE